MLVEPLVLDRNDSLDEVGRDAVERNLDALFLEDREDGLIVRVKERRGLRHGADAAERLRVGQAGRQVVTEPGRVAAGQEQCDGHRRHEPAEQARSAGKQGTDPFDGWSEKPH